MNARSVSSWLHCVAVQWRRGDNTRIAELDVQALREASEEFSVVRRNTATLQERIELLQDGIGVPFGEATKRSLFVLTMGTVSAVPINSSPGCSASTSGGCRWSSIRMGFESSSRSSRTSRWSQSGSCSGANVNTKRAAAPASYGFGRNVSIA